MHQNHRSRFASALLVALVGAFAGGYSLAYADSATPPSTGDSQSISINGPSVGAAPNGTGNGFDSSSSDLPESGSVIGGSSEISHEGADPVQEQDDPDAPGWHVSAPPTNAHPVLSAPEVFARYQEPSS